MYKYIYFLVFISVSGVFCDPFYFVNSNTGVDSSTCGMKATPCKSFGYPLKNLFVPSLNIDPNNLPPTYGPVELIIADGVYEGPANLNVDLCRYNVTFTPSNSVNPNLVFRNNDSTQPMFTISDPNQDLLKSALFLKNIVFESINGASFIYSNQQSLLNRDIRIIISNAEFNGQTFSDVPLIHLEFNNSPMVQPQQGLLSIYGSQFNDNTLASNTNTAVLFYTNKNLQIEMTMFKNNSLPLISTGSQANVNLITCLFANNVNSLNIENFSYINLDGSNNVYITNTNFTGHDTTVSSQGIISGTDTTLLYTYSSIYQDNHGTPFTLLDTNSFFADSFFINNQKQNNSINGAAVQSIASSLTKGIYVTLQNTLFKENSALVSNSEDNSALYTRLISNIQISLCQFIDNSIGGFASIQNQIVKISSMTTFSGNSGSIFCQSPITFVDQSSTFKNNSVDITKDLVYNGKTTDGVVCIKPTTQSNTICDAKNTKLSDDSITVNIVEECGLTVNSSSILHFNNLFVVLILLLLIL